MSVDTIVSIYAAVVSTAVLLWNVQASFTKTKVKIGRGFDEREGQIREGAWISIQNMSSKPVYIVGADLLYRSETIQLRDRIAFVLKYRRLSRTIGWTHIPLGLNKIEADLPVSVEPGNAHGILIPWDVVIRYLDTVIDGKIRASAQDALNRDTISKSQDFSADIIRWKERSK